jgi:RNA polymerase sigma factor (sigma-70 family)
MDAMEDAEPDPQLAELTAEMAWLRRLARALLRGDEAEDLAHEAWLVAAQKRPDDDRPLRPWLARVTRNLVRMQARSRTRREARETVSASDAAPASTPDELVQRVELQQLVAGEVLQLAEPYRSTVLLHYFEELSCAEIARRQALPEGTVRRRLKTALDELRARIDRRERRSGGLAVLAPLAGVALPSQSAAPLALGVIVMKKVAIALVVLLVILAAVLWRSHSSHDGGKQAAGTTGGAAAGMRGAAAFAASGEGAAKIPLWLIQPGVMPQRIAGRVTYHGAPVAGATVELGSLASEAGLVAAPQRMTTSTGDFDFGTQPAMPFSVRATAPGKSGVSIDVDLREPHGAPPPDRLELALGACTAALFGTVRDASGGPVANARIARLPGPRSPVQAGISVLTNDKGAYELCVETQWPGVVGIAVSADGYAAVTATTIVPGRVKLDIALVPEATIVGHVVREDNGAPVANAYVFVPYGPPGVESTPLRTTFSDATGHFRLDRMTAGRHLVFARAEGMSESLQGTPAVVGVGQTSVEIELRLAVGSTIRGTVVDHAHKPIGGATVAAIDRLYGTTAATGVSQDDGSFVLTGVPHGEIRFTAQPYEVVKPTTLQVVQPTHDAVTLEVEPLGTILGHVVRNDQPLAGAIVDLHGPNERELRPVQADAHGYFEAHGLRPGAWSVAAEDMHIGAFGALAEPVHLGPGETKEVTVDVKYAASIAGRVVDQNGAPVPSVMVLFRHIRSDDAGQATTDVDGNFRAATMTGGGEYRATVMRSLLASTALPPASGNPFPLISLSDGNASVTGIVLAVRVDHLSIAGTVVDGDGAPVSDARVVAHLTDGEMRGVRQAQDPADTTDVNGHFAIEDLLAGTYTLGARSAAGVDTELAGVRAGRADVKLVLPASGGIDVTTMGFTTPPRVTAMRLGGTPSAPIVATQQGTLFALRNLSPGNYAVVARTVTEAASAVVEVTGGRTARTTLTSAGSGVIAGHVRELRSGKPVEGTTCRAIPRITTDPGAENDPLGSLPGDGVRTDAQGAFLIAAAPAGPIAVTCDGLLQTYSDGLRLITLTAGQRVDLDEPVVGWTHVDGLTPLASIGAFIDAGGLIARLVNVEPGGPAATAGFADGDVVVGVDGTSVTELSANGVWLFLVNRQPGTKMKLAATRNGKTITGELTLGDRPL